MTQYYIAITVITRVRLAFFCETVPSMCKHLHNIIIIWRLRKIEHDWYWKLKLFYNMFTQ